MQPALKRLALQLRLSQSHTQETLRGTNGPLLPLIAIAWCIGSVFGLIAQSIEPLEWLLLTTVVCFAAYTLHQLKIPVIRATLFAAFVTLSAAHAATNRSTTSAQLAKLTPLADGRVVEVYGTVTQNPQTIQRRQSRLESFGYSAQPVTFFLSDATVSLKGKPLVTEVASLRVVVRVESTAMLAYQRGDTISVRGRLKRREPPTNPTAEPHFPGLPWVEVPCSQLISLEDSEPTKTKIDYRDLQETWHLVVHQALDQALEYAPSLHAKELVCAIVLGIRNENFRTISEPYRKTGLAHYLAVSGFAFGVLVALPSAACISTRPILRTIVITTVIVLGLTAIDLRAPALRAGIVACMITLGSMIGRDWNQKSLLALAGLLLLIHDPKEVLNPGFQLSFAVVTGLILFAPRLACRLPFQTSENDGRITSLFSHWLRTAIACGCVAWGVATPIVLFHYGLFSPIGIFVSVLAAPLVALIVALAIAAITVGLISPICALIPGTISGWCAQGLDVFANTSSDLPGAFFILAAPNLFWVVLAECVAWRWYVHVTKRERLLLSVITAILLVTLFLPRTYTAAPNSLELLTLDVGNGTCHVLTGPSGSVLVDSGSMHGGAFGSRVVLPALKEHGISTLEAIIITHANLDHFSCVGDLVGRIPIGEIVVGQSFLKDALKHTDGATSECLRMARLWDIPVRTVVAGDQENFCGLSWEILHPPRDSHWNKENNASLVLQVKFSNRKRDPQSEILFTGDIEEEAIHHLLQSEEHKLGATILEIPHHGSVCRFTEQFIRSVNPDIIIQSTGRHRLFRDKLKPLVQGRKRLATPIFGAIHLSKNQAGSIELRVFKAPGDRLSDS